MRPLHRRATLVLLLGVLAIPGGPARAEWSGRAPGPPDPLFAMLHRMDTFLHQEELEGITRDPRYAVNPAEFIRLSVVCQLLGYLELERSIPETRTHRTDILERADFLVAHFDDVRSGSAADGMLGYALLGAWEETGDPRYLDAARPILEASKRLYGSQATLNWGLMAAMALARAHRQSGDLEALAMVDAIVGSLDRHRGVDGSYPHLCARAPDVHYTGWMTMELIIIARELDDPARWELALRAAPFLAARVGPEGETQYWAPCEACPGRVAAYYSLGGGCAHDYDTRGWLNELGYLALAFDQAGDPRYADVLGFLAAHEDRGAFPDKWAYFPPPGDPILVWGCEPRSVIRTSVLFWTLAMILAGRERPAASGPVHVAAMAGGMDEGSGAASALTWDPAAATLRFGLATPTPGVWLAIHDVRGRVVRRLLDRESRGAGANAVTWDQCDERGRVVAPGIYFARLVAGARREVERIPCAR